MEVDVYIHHMDAETDPEDNAARESQMTQLVDEILATDNNRPIIIMGDTNCRYTRDKLIELMFNRINADERFTMHDPWVEFMWAAEGGYEAPELQLGKEALMTHNQALGPQKGEVVDKIFYIENNKSNLTITAERFRSETTFTETGLEGGTPLSDHFPVVVTFSLSTSTASPGTEYYLRNKATGKFLNQGADYGVRAVLEEYGNRITLEDANDGNFYLKSTAGYTFVDWRPGLFIDTSVDNRDAFKLEDGPNGGYYIRNTRDNSYVTAPTDGTSVIIDPVTGKRTGENLNSQIWEFLTVDDLKKEMRKASDTNPVDATFFIKGANFNPSDADRSAWTINLHKGGGLINNSPAASYNYDNYVLCLFNEGKKSNGAWDFHQELTGLPNGKYRLSFHGYASTGITFKVAGTQIGVSDNNAAGVNVTNINDCATWGKDSLANDKYKLTTDVIEITDGRLMIECEKGNNSSTQFAVFDDFRLTYYGPTAAKLVAEGRVKAALDDAADWLETFDDDGKEMYNNSMVERNYDNRQLSDTGKDEVNMTYLALAKAAKSQTTAGSDMTPAITNWSFELFWMHNVNDEGVVDRRGAPGWATHWPGQTWGDVGVYENTNSTYTCSNTDGDYLMNVYDGAAAYYSAPVAQTVTGLPNGVYRVTALVTSWEDRNVYVFANGEFSAPARVTEGVGKFEEASVEVEVSNGEITLGACGQADGGGHPVIPVNNADELWGDQNANGEIWNNCFFKADNFRLTYVGSLEYNILAEAIREAEAVSKKNNLNVDFTEYKTKVTNRAVSNPVSRDVQEVFNLLGNAVKAQDVAGSDMTYAIMNNSFEWTKYGFYLEHWNARIVGETKIVEANHPDLIGTYGVTGLDGVNVFNIYEGGNGYDISQNIEGMPAGRYKLSALVASDNGNLFYLVGGTPEARVISSDVTTTDKGEFVPVEFEFEYRDLTQPMQIGLGTKGKWYKTDNFRLTLVEPISADIEWISEFDTHGTIVLPFAADVPAGLKAYSVTVDGEATAMPDDETKSWQLINLNEVDKLEAHKTYLMMPAEQGPSAIRPMSVTEGESDSYTFTGVRHHNETPDSNGTIIGTYTPETTVEAGHYMVHADGFEKIATDSQVAAHHGYIDGKSEGAPTADYLLFTEPESDTTGIDAIMAGEAGTIDIYDLNGVRLHKDVMPAEALESLAPGIYIIRSGNQAIKVLK